VSYIGIAQSGEILFTTDDEGVHDFGQIQGDVLGLIQSTVVSGIVGFPISSLVPVSGQIITFDGSTWQFTPDATGDAAPPHTLLSATHIDTDPATPIQGGLIRANSTPLWEQMTLGLNGEVVFSNGTDVTYTSLGVNTPFELGSIGAPSVVGSGDLDTGLSWGAADVLNASAGASLLLQLNGPSGNILLNGGIVHKITTINIDTNLSNDDYLVLVFAASVNVTLPPSPDPGQQVVIKDRDGLANSVPNAITIFGSGNTIDGNPDIQIRNRYGSFTLVYNGVGEWNVV